MYLQPQKFDPCQQMKEETYELHYKRDMYLDNVELHHHDFYEIYFLVSGCVTYTIESKLYRVMPGDILLISPKELHQVHIQPEMDAYERYVLWVEPNAVRQLSTVQTDLSRCLDREDPGYGNQFRPDEENKRLIQYLMETLYRETQIKRYGSDLLQINLLTQLLVTINRVASQKNKYLENTVKTSKTVLQAIAYINQNYSEDISLEQLADHLYVSKYYLSHEFQRVVGTTVCRYIRKKRLMIARQRLSAGEKPNDVYVPCGFGDYAGFYKAFKAEYGIAPREFAQESRKKNDKLQK